MRARHALPVRTLPLDREAAGRRDGALVAVPETSTPVPAAPLTSDAPVAPARREPASTTWAPAPTLGAPGHAAGEDARRSHTPTLPLSRSPAAVRDAQDVLKAEDAPELREALRDVMDPELPLSIVDLGLVYGVRARAGVVEVDLTYTATGCPCMEFIHDDVRARLLREPGVAEVRIRDVWDPPWTSARISAEGRAVLRRHGVTA